MRIQLHMRIPHVASSTAHWSLEQIILQGLEFILEKTMRNADCDGRSGGAEAVDDDAVVST